MTSINNNTTNTTYYDVLGVSKTASDIEIKKAYRALSLKYHPDKNSSPEARDMYVRINEAYETLGDPEKRNQYDTTTSTPKIIKHPEEDLFNMMVHMNNIFFQHALHKPAPLIHTVYLTLEQLYSGCTIPVTLQKWEILGAERREIQEIVTVVVPTGIADDTIMVFRDQGHTLNQVHGDVKLVFKTLPHSAFTRQGKSDLVMKRTITLKEALCGFEFDIDHVNGKTIHVKNYTTIITPEYQQVLPHLGLPSPGTTVSHGNLLLVFEIAFPTSLTDTQKNELMRILE